ncbi:hypothetical protein Acr_17g0008250 [Actinidia rufa]|uniref:F-box family protein n=1 Tax=Actinidia rufa TaxID=165716 RepID=A0A7J0G399_9ERIC|nr:hypothetical protein Acr_17g0008250 [Actinidia rufa]
MALASLNTSKQRNCKQEDDEPRSGMESLPHDVALDILFRLPISSLVQSRCNYHLVVLGGCLSTVILYHFVRFEIWVMGEYNVKESWIKKFIIQDYSPQFMKSRWRPSYRIWKNVLSQKNARILCQLENGNSLIEYKGGVEVSHDPCSGAFKKQTFQGMPDLSRSVAHVSSLNWVDNIIHRSTEK